MTTTINASPTNGIVQTADGSGVMKLQSNGVTTNALAWVNFNGTGTVAIRSSYNVSSITDNGTGIYTINFTNALADANYSVNCTVSDDNVSAGGRSGNVMMLSVGTPPTSSALRVFNLFGASSSTTAGYGDVTYACVSVFGN